MKTHMGKFIILLCSTFTLGCGPQKKEETPIRAEKQEEPMKQMKNEKAPVQNKEETLTPHQQEELKINEDNVMNPFPG